MLSMFRKSKVTPHGHSSHWQPSDIGGAHSFAEPPPHIFALIIGINKYKSRHIPNLVGAVPDADAVRDYLQKHLGVPSSQIRNLRNSEATRAAIIDGIKAFTLNGEIKEGDSILIYYAGHGGSTGTPKGWEVGSTGKIELLIPYDHSSPLEGGNHRHGIPDRTLGALLSHLAVEKGNNITVILDCCHSGSGTRNIIDPTFKARGIDVGNIPPSNLDEDIWSAFEWSGRGTEVHSGFARKGLRSHVLLAACHSQELAYERTSRGVFTVALLKTLMDNGIELTYATLFDRMPLLSSGQNPQCEGVFRERSIFNGKASGKRPASVYYKIRKSEGKTYVMPDAGEAAGITMDAEFEVYQDQNSGHLLGTVVVCELTAFSTTLYAKESRIALERDGVALKSRAGTEERVRIHVADGNLKNLVKKIDPNQRTIQLVERDHEAEFGIAFEKGKVVFNIYDSDVTRYGLTRMPHTVEPTLEAISFVIHAAARFYWHRRRTLQTGRRGLAEKVDIKATELKLERIEHDDELKPVYIYGPNASDDWKGGNDFDVQTGTLYGWRIINNCNMPLYPALFYFDNSDWSITPYYVPPIARGIVEPPLEGKGYLTVGYGDSGSVPHSFFLREGQKVDVGILKLFLSRKQVDLSHIAQSSPFAPNGGRSTALSPSIVPIGGRSTMPSPPFVPIGGRTNIPSLPFVSSRGTVRAVVPEDFGSTSLRLPWDTIEIPVVQRRAKGTS